MRQRIVEDERKGADDAGKHQAAGGSLEQQPHEYQVEQQMRRHGEIRDRHSGEAGRTERKQHRPAACLRRAGHAHGDPAYEDQRERGEERIACPGRVHEAERRQEQREPRPVRRSNLPGLK